MLGMSVMVAATAAAEIALATATAVTATRAAAAILANQRVYVSNDIWTTCIVSVGCVLSCTLHHCYLIVDICSG